MTVYLEEVETSWLLISLHDKENFTIKRTGVCDWTTAKTSSQNSRKTVVLQLESSWVVEKLMFFRSLYENEISCCFNSIWECCIKLQQALKKVKYLECFFLLTLKSAILLDANHSARKEKGNIWSTSFGFEVKKNCSSKLLLNYFSAKGDFLGSALTRGRLEEVFLLLIFSRLSLTNSRHTALNWTPGTCQNWLKNLDGEREVS